MWTQIAFPQTSVGAKTQLTRILANLESIQDANAYALAIEFFIMLSRSDGLAGKLVADDAVRIAHANTDADRYAVINSRILWLKDRVIQCDYVGQVFDYSRYVLGALTPLGVAVETCPICGKLGQISMAHGFVYVVHAERINSWLTTTVISRCDRAPKT